MKKFVLPMLLASAVLTACGSTEVEEKDAKVESNAAATEEAATNEEATGSQTELNQLIADDKNVKATLVSVVEKEDDIWGNSIEVKFEVENKTSETIEVQAREVSADNKMVDEAMLSMSTEISPGKVADCVLSISEMEGYTLPTLEENLEMKLHVFSWDNYDFQVDYPVNVTF